MANCHSSVKNPDAMRIGDQQESPASKPGPRPLQYSISNLVQSIQRLQRLCWYVVLLWKIIVFLIRWESPFVTLSFWITSLLISYFMESGQLLASSLALLALLAGAGGLAKLKLPEYSPRASGSRPPNGPNSSATPAANAAQGGEQNSADIEQQQKKGKEMLAEYRRLMLLAQDRLGAACDTMERLHGVLAWQDATWSPVLYGGATVAMTTLYLLPLRWFVMATLSTALCFNRGFAAVLLQVYDSVLRAYTPVGNNNKEGMADFSHVLQEQDSKEKPSVKAEPPIHHDIQHRPLHLCQKSKSLDEAGPNYAKLTAANRNRSSTAPELPTLKLNSVGVPVEVCHLCGTMFSSVLKRRRYCRSCGNQFCQRCCSRKLPRSVFGATAPAAMTEKELVCNACFCSMTADEVNPTTSGTTIEEH